MHFRQNVAVCLNCFFVFWGTAFCAPTQPAFPNLLNAGSGLTIPPQRPSNGSILGALCSSSIGHSAKVRTDDMTWHISDTLSLVLTICNWEPGPKTIRAVLAAADTAIGKKAAAGLLDQKFTQKSDNKYNTLLFEITPGHIYKRLTWGDVGEVLGENGLPKFYETTSLWHTIYFDVMHTTRGELGQGAVRRWWQLEPLNGRNGTAIGGSGVFVNAESENRSGILD